MLKTLFLLPTVMNYRKPIHTFLFVCLILKKSCIVHLLFPVEIVVLDCKQKKLAIKKKNVVPLAKYGYSLGLSMSASSSLN